MTKVTFTSNPIASCTDYCKRDYYPTSFWKRDSTREATNKVNWSPGFWTHDWRPVQFTLVVDDFGVKYVGEEHAIHLKNTIKEN